ncbi:MAG TPA: S8 family serine peptidase [Phycisphaerae bacterium]|nr:S8 family serine peptidase [Phycisphaerae bacterium]
MASTSEALGSNPHALYLLSGTVDTEQLPSLLNTTEAFDSAAFYVLQLDGPMTRDGQAKLESSGITVGDYLPMNAFTVRGDTLNSANRDALDFIRWIGRYDHAWKLGPNISRLSVFQTDERIALEDAGFKRLSVFLFAGSDIAAAIQGLESFGAAILDVRPRGANAQIELEIDAAIAPQLANVAEVLFVDEAPEGSPRNSSTAWVTQSNVSGLKPLYAAGLHGEGQIAALVDWDLDDTHCSFSDVVPFGPGHRKIVEFYDNHPAQGTFAYHGTYTGSVLAGHEVAESNADLRGQAYAAKMVVQNYESNITTVNLLDRLGYSQSFGAHVHSNSWGSNNVNTYSQWCRDIDMFTHGNEEDLVVVAIINGSAASIEGSILSPENAKNCLATAAAKDAPLQNDHGSGARGPTLDGRQKPEIWISGCPTAAQNATACSSTTRQCATSWSAPVASAMAVLTRQYFMQGFYPSGGPTGVDAFTPSGALLKAIIINSAVDMNGFAGYYGTHEGWGRVLMGDALYFSGDARRLVVHDILHAEGLSTGEIDSVSVNVSGATERLKVTLVWSDAPATVSAEFAPVNDLDLIVIDPSGNTYLGNNFSGVNSITGGAADVRNNNEQVHLAAPMPGEWTIRMPGTAVNVGTQGYALVITGDVAPGDACLKGDMNRDGGVDGEDVQRFSSVLLDEGTARELCAADISGADGAGFEDVGPFVDLLLAGN